VFLQLYGGSPDAPELLARVTRTEKPAVVLEITTEAIQAGLLEPSIVSVALLQCGLTID
jgi:hypothetical protein